MKPTVGVKILLATVCAVAVATIYAAQPVLALIGHDLGVPDAELGSIVTAGQLGYLVGPLGATATTAAFSAAGWTASALLGAAFAACAFVTWVFSRPAHRTPR